MGYNQKKYKGFTLLELVIVSVILPILSVTGAYLMTNWVQDSVFIPNQLNMDMAASEALDIMIEGDNTAKGLRFSRAITNVQDYQVTFINQDGQTVRYRMDPVLQRLYRSINGGAEASFPYYVLTGISLSGKANKLFSYFDVNSLVTATPANVRRIAMTMIAMTGTGSFSDWQGQSEQQSAIAVNKYQ